MFKTDIKNKIFILVFLAILILPWIAGGMVRLVSAKAYNSLTTVETENRKMTQVEWAELLNTGESISNCVDDRIPFRYSLINLYKGATQVVESKYRILETAVGSHFYTAKAEPEVDKEKTNQPIVPGEEIQEASASVEEGQDPDYFPVMTFLDVLVGRDNWLFMYGENEIECYQGTNLLSEDEMEEYARKVRKLEKLCKAQGKELYIYIAPNKSSVYSRYMPTIEVVEPYRRIQRLYDWINNNTDTPFIYPLGEEYIAAERYQVYYKYDSHWNHLGGLFGVNALYDAMGIDYQDPSVWLKGQKDAEKYELYYYMGVKDEDIVHNDLEWIVDYKPEIEVNGLNTEAMVNRTTSNGPIDKKLCFIGDSFRVYMMDYLAKDFTHCTFAHRDYMKGIHDDIKNADVIVIEAVERYDYEGFKSLQRTINVLSE